MGQNAASRLSVCCTFAELCEAFLRDSRKISDSTRYNMRRYLEAHAIPSLGQREARTVTSDQIRRVEDAASHAGGRHLPYQLDLTLRKVFSYAVENNVLCQNPCDGIPRLRHKLYVNLEHFSDEELRRIWPVVHTLENANLYGLALVSGHLERELLGLSPEDVDLEHGRMRIHRSATFENRSKGAFELRDLDCPRTVDVSEASTVFLKRQLETYRRHTQTKGLDCPTLFLCNESGPVSPYGIIKDRDLVRSEAGVASFGFASMRRNYLIRSVKAGADFYALRDHLGYRGLERLFQIEEALELQSRTSASYERIAESTSPQPNAEGEGDEMPPR